VTILPTTIFAVFVAGLYRAGALTGAPSLDALLAPPSSASSLIGLACAIVVTSVIIQPFQIALVRLLEGYWGSSRIATSLSSVGVELQRRRVMRLRSVHELGRGTAGQPSRSGENPQAVEAAHLAGNELRRFPPLKRLLPTRLGNALRAAEDTAGERYGLTTVVTYPRLYPMLSERLRLGIGELVDQLDTAAGLTVSFLAATTLGLVALLDDGWWLLIPAATLALAWLSYRGAISAATYHGVLLATAFDLHRFDLVAALHVALPATPDEELVLHRQLSAFLREQHVESTELEISQYLHPESAGAVRPVSRRRQRR
jgi:hypothetical protein